MCRLPLHVFYAAMFGAILLVASPVSMLQVVYAPSLTISFANVVGNQVLSGNYEVVVSASDSSLVSNIKLWVDDVTFIKQE